MDSRRFVYILRSDTQPDRQYVGLACDVSQRLAWHNSGPSGVTVHHRPWSVVVALEFADAATAGTIRALLEDRLRPRVRQTALCGGALNRRGAARAIARTCVSDAMAQGLQPHRA